MIQHAPTAARRLPFVFVALFLACLASGLRAGTPPNPAFPVPDYAQTPLRFEPNAGQADAQARYITRGDGYSMYFLPTEIALALDVDTNTGAASPDPVTNHQHRLLLTHPTHKATGVVHLKWEGANTRVAMLPEELLPTKINYLIGNDPTQWRAGLSTYGRVRCHGLYPGIDLVFYGNQTHLEYDFVVQPHADPHAIRLDIQGADQIHIETNGDLTFSTLGRVTRFCKPDVYQIVHGQKREITGSYQLKGNRISFVLGRYDHNAELVIDPVLSYSTFLGGKNGSAWGNGIAVDAGGNAYVASFATSTMTNLVTPGVFQTTNRGGYYGYDCFIAKIGSTGTNLVYLTYLGGSGDDFALGIAVDAAGNAYLTGVTESPDFPVKNPIFPHITSDYISNLGIYDDCGFVAELNTNGSALVYSTYLGSEVATEPMCIAMDSQNNVYVGGLTCGYNFPVTNAVQNHWNPHTTYDPNSNDRYDAFLTKINSSGSALVYSTYYGGTWEDTVRGVAVDKTGSLYAAGYTYSTDLFVTNAVQSTYQGGAHDAFVVKLDPTGTNVVFSTFLGGTGEDDAFGVAVDTNNNVYVTGQTYSTGFPLTNALQNLLNGNGSTGTSDGFITKLSATGQLLYSSFLGGSGPDNAFGVAVQPDGSMVVVGQTGSIDFAPYANYGSINSGNLDAFIAKLSSDGATLKNFAYLGGNNADQATGVALDSQQNAYVAGYTTSTNYPVTSTNVVDATFSGQQDLFLTKLYFEPNQLGTTVTTSWQPTNGWAAIGPAAVLATSNLWPNASQPASVSTNGVTSFSNTRFERGTSYDPTFTSFIIPLTQQTGFRLDDTGVNAEYFGGSRPWFTRLQNDTRTHLTLVSSTNVAGFSTNHYGYATNFNNPIAAFGAISGNSALYVNEQAKFGVYCGAQYESTNSDGASFTAPLRILVYNLSSFVAGQTNLIAPIATNYITIPRRTIDQAAWNQLATNGFALTVETNGLRTTIQLAAESGGAWGVVPQFTNAQSGTYVITHECTTNVGYGYVVEGLGVVPLGTNLYPMVTNAAGTVGWDRLYSLDFSTRSPWRSVFIDQPQFNGQPMPSFYAGESPAELTNLNAVVTNSVSLAGSAYTTVDDSPELRRHPLLDQLVYELDNDPIAIANYVQNRIELTDALAYNANNGQASAPAVNEGGVNRSALDVYLEGQGSPLEQCALLVYLLRQAGYPAAYVFPTNNNVQMLDTRLSSLLRMQLHGAVNQYGQLDTTNTLITVNYPWVVTTVSNQTVHLFPWLKDTQITEGLNLYDYMPTNYDNGFKWLQQYLYGDTNILGLSLESDAPSVLFPRFVKQQLLTNAPGVSLDDIGVDAYDRQNYYSRWLDFPTPSVVNNPGQIVCVDSLGSPAITNVAPAMTNLFDTVTLTIHSQVNTNTAMTIGPLRMADLHDRELFMTTNGANGLTLWLAPYLPGNTNTVGNFTDSPLTNVEVATLTISTNDTLLAVHMSHARHQVINFSPSNQFLNVSETLQFTTPDRPFNPQDITALCFNVGRVTPAMINVHASAFQQTAYQWSLNTNTVPAVADYQGAAAYLMGMDYYSHVSAFLPVCEQLHKARVVSWYAEGLSRLTPVQLGAQNFMRPSMDMFYSEMAHAGNGTAHPDSGNDPLAGTDDFSAIMEGEIAAQEHSIINGYYQSQDSISAVVLLRLAQERATNGVAGILELNRNNYLALGATNAAGYGYTHLQNYDPVIWAAVTNAFNGWDADYVRAYITPGPVSVQVASYRGMGLVIVGQSQSASLISVNMNGVLGQQSLYFGDVPAAISTAYSSTAPLDSFSGDGNFDASAGYGSYFNGGDLYYGSSANGSSGFDYYWTTPNWYAGSTALWPYVMPANYYQVSAVATPPSQINLSQQINALYHFPQSTPVATSLTHALDSGNTGSPTWKNLNNYVYDPVNVMSGEFYHDASDLTLAGPQPLQLRRNYSSQDQDDRNGFGYGWNINVVPYLGVATNATTNVILTAVELDGSVIAYRQQTTNLNVYLPSLADNLQLDNDGDGRIGSVHNPFNGQIVHSFAGTNEVYTLTGSDGQVRTYVVNSFPVNTPTNTIYRQRPYLTRWLDTQGNAWTFLYGTNSAASSYGSVVRIQASNGNYLGLDYNAGGYVVAAYATDGARTGYEYDDFGDLVSMTRADGTEEDYEYQHIQYTNNGTVYVDSTHLLIKEYKPDGRVLENVYDGNRRVVNQLATVGTDLNLYTNATFIYSNNFVLNPTNAISGYTLVRDVNGNTNRYDYLNGLVTTNTDQLGQTIIQAWYADGATSPGYSRSLYQTRDKRGRWTQYQYDSQGNLTNVFTWGDLTGDGSLQYATNSASYNGNNLPLTAIDPVGNAVQTVYGAAYPYLPQAVVFLANGTPTATNQYTYGNVTNVVVNGTLTLTNIAFGVLQQQVLAANSPDAATNQWSFDGRGYPVQQVQFTGTADPAVTNYLYCDNSGDLVSRLDGAGQVNLFDYDALRRPITHRVFAAGQADPMYWEDLYYDDNGEVNWYDGPRYNPEDYQWFDHDGAGRLTTHLRWRSEAKADGSGLEAPSGANLYSQSFYQYDKFGNLTLAVDPRGAMVTNQWDKLGQLVQQTHLDTNGTTVLSAESFAYEPGGLVQYATNALGGVTTTYYTTNGLPKYRSYPDGSTNAWRYYLDGRLKLAIQGNGAYWLTTYDDVNRITTRVFYSAGGTALATNSVQLDRRGNVVRTVDNGGNAFTAMYDGLNRVKVAGGPTMATITGSSGFSPGGPVTYTTNYLQQAVTNFYDAAGVVQTNVNALGERAVAWFDALGRVTEAQLYSATGTLVRQTSLAYSPDFNSVTVTNGTGTNIVVSTTYQDNDGNTVLAVGNPAPGNTEYVLNQFDLAGNLVAQLHNSNTGGTITNWTTASFTYDGLNRLTGKTDRDGALTTYFYDNLGDVTNVTLPGSWQWRAVFNNAGQMLKDWDANGASFTRSNNYAYFASGSPFAGLLQSQVDGRNTTNTLAYDDWLRVTNLVSSGTLPEQNVTTGWRYEPRGYVTGMTEQFASTNTGPATSLSRAFDAYGQLTTEAVTNGAIGYTTSQGWDGAGRRVSLTFGNSVNYRYGWQADGALTYASNPTGSGTYSYTTAGLLYNRVVGNRVTTMAARDGEGRPTSINNAVNYGTELTETLAWSGDGLMTADAVWRGDFGIDFHGYTYASQSRRLTQEQLCLNASTTWTNTFAYDNGGAGGPGALTSAAQWGGGAAAWSGGADAFSRVSAETNTDFAYPAYGHVNGQSTLEAWLDNHPLAITGLGTNAMQWRAGMELSPGSHQLKVAALHPSGFYTAWTTNTFTNNIAYQTTIDAFDGAGDITNRIWRTASGATNRTQTLSWDARGRLHAVTERDASNNGYNWTATYDAANRRLAAATALVTNGVVYPASTQVLSAYFDPQVEFLDLGVANGSQITWKLYGPDLNGTYGGMNGVGGLDGVSPYIDTFNPTLSDARGNLLAEVTNSTVSWFSSRPTGYGAVPNYRPAAFGSGADLAQSSAWLGREVDLTGLYNLGRRPYDPVSGRWLSFDPAWNDADPNGFSFNGGDPINFVDSDGRVGKYALDADQAISSPFAHAIHTGIAEGLANAWFSLAQFTTKAGLQEANLSELSPVANFFFQTTHETVSDVFNAHTSSFNRTQGELYAWSGFAGEMAPNFVPVGGAEMATARLTSLAAERFPILGQDVAAWFGQGSKNLSTWQDFLPQAQAIVDRTKAQFGSAEAYGMASPNAAARKAAQGQYINPLNNQIVSTKARLAADHIFPQVEIKNMAGFNMLTAAQQDAVLNNLKNFQGLPQTFNSSKGGLLPSQWTTYKGQPLDPSYIQRNQVLEQDLRSVLQQQINDFIEQNSANRQ